MLSALAVFDYCQTVGVSIALLATIPPAGFVYFKVIFSRKFSARYIFKLIAINGIAAILNTIIWLFIAQLTSFDFMRGFYLYIQNFGIATPLAAVNAFFGDLALNSSLFIALNRMTAMLSYGKRDNDFILFLGSGLMTLVLTLPAVLDYLFTSMVYIEISFGGESILIPNVIVTNEFYRILSYVIRVVVSLATFLLNVILCVFVTRERRNISVTQKKRFNAEKGLVITGVLAYATYMISFVNNLIARYFNVLFCGYAQWIFVGIKSIAPFWCLIAFTPSVRRLFVSRKQASSTTPVKSITLTA